MRTLVIGDIHGGYTALKQVVERASITPKDMLLFLGDYVDGWSQSAQTISYLQTLSLTHNCIFMKGNHDDLCYQFLKNNKKPTQWVQQGGQSSIKSYENIKSDEIQKHLLFFESLKAYFIDANNRLFIHAGFQNQKGPQFEHHKTAYYWDRTLWEMALATDVRLAKQDIRYPKRLQLFKEIFIGHTPVTLIGKTTPVNCHSVWNMDTGAAFKGPVTIMDVDTKEFWQSDPVWTLYPNEKGRNVI